MFHNMKTDMADIQNEIEQLREVIDNLQEQLNKVKRADERDVKRDEELNRVNKNIGLHHLIHTAFYRFPQPKKLRIYRMLQTSLTSI